MIYRCTKILMAIIVWALIFIPNAQAKSSTGQLIADYIVVTYLYGQSADDPRSSYVYVRDIPLANGDEIKYGSLLIHDSYHAFDGQYLAWIDDGHGAGFEHSSRIVIATVTGDLVAIDHLIDTEMPIILNETPIWSDVSAANGQDIYFPNITFWDVSDPDVGAPEKGCKFTNGENASGLTIYGNSDEANAGDTKEEISDIMDDSGIPEDRQHSLDFATCTGPTGNDMNKAIRDAIKDAAQDGTGPEFVLALSAHGYDGGICFDKGKPASCISYSELLCLICEALTGTNKSRVLMIIESCHSGSAIAALNALNCPECAGFEFGIAAACAADEKSYPSDHILFDGCPWDFPEELEDESWCWDDMMKVAEEGTKGAANDIDNSDQHPQWGGRTFPHAACINNYALFIGVVGGTARYDVNSDVVVVEPGGAERWDTGSGTWVPVAAGEKLEAGTSVRVPAGGKCKVIPAAPGIFALATDPERTIGLNLINGTMTICECGACFGDEHCGGATALGLFYIAESGLYDTNCTVMELTHDSAQMITTVCNRPGSDFNVEFIVIVGPDSGTVHVLEPGKCATIDEFGTITYNIWPTAIHIESVPNSLQGHYVIVPIAIEGSILEMGGFDFLIGYDAAALALTAVEPGALLDTCDWEYFTYHIGAEGNCGLSCPSGLLRIIALAETNNGDNHPYCFGPPDTNPHELARMKFLVSDDPAFECQHIPISFFWGYCGDNVVSNIEGNLLYIDQAIFDHEGNLIWDEENDLEFPEYSRIPFVGTPDSCLNSEPEGLSPLRLIDFINGGLNIICIGGKAIIEPAVQSVIDAYRIYPIDDRVFIGNLKDHGVADIDRSSLRVNETIEPTATDILTSYPGFEGEVLRVTFSAAPFIEDYEPVWGSTSEDFLITGKYSDNIGFTIPGNITFVGHRPADVDCDGFVNIKDITFLINYLYKSGPAPAFMPTGDANADGRIDLRDITHIIRFLYQDGPPPIHP